jgi:hypothetical protein
MSLHALIHSLDGLSLMHNVITSDPTLHTIFTTILTESYLCIIMLFLHTLHIITTLFWGFAVVFHVRVVC